MEHVEAAGIHSGDSACATPPHTLDRATQDCIEDACARIALELKVIGLMNVQIAVKDGEIYIIEVNPRASRTVPYLSKATGVPLAKVAAKVALGRSLKDLGLTGRRAEMAWCAVKEAVLPFDRFAGADPTLGPEMKSTGEVMGIDRNFELAYWKGQIAAGQNLPRTGTVFLSAREDDKWWMVEIARQLTDMGFEIVATRGSARALRAAGLNAEIVHRLAEKKSPNILDLMHKNEVHLLINTPSGPVARVDEIRIRSEAVLRGIPLVTTRPGAYATVSSIRYVRDNDWGVAALQDYFPPVPTT